MEDVTRRLVEAGKLLGIEVLDHLVLNSNNSFTSLSKRQRDFYFFVEISSGDVSYS